MRKFLFLSGLLIYAFISQAQVDNAQRSAALQLVKANSIALGMSLTDINNVFVSSIYQIKGTDITMVYLQQTYLGVPIYNQMQVLAFKNGQLVSNAGSRLPSMEKLARGMNEIPSVSPVQAVRSAFAERNIIEKELPVPVSVSVDGHILEFGRLGVASRSIKTELIWLPGENNMVRLAWQVQLAPNSTPDYWIIRIDAKTGLYVDKINLTITCNWDNKQHSIESHLAEPHFKDDFTLVIQKQNNKDWRYWPFIVSDANYTVIKYPAESPQHSGGAPSVHSNPWLLTPGNATSLGWHFDGTIIHDSTRGNNVWAQEDRDNNDNTFGRTTLSSTGQPSLNFANVYNFSLTPTEATLNNQRAAVTNLFYWNNLMHDISYAYGFDEVSGNFQNSNQGRGGLGADYVIADAQDAGNTNNANMSTPDDGFSPRMQMYLFTTTSPNRDGDLDNGIISHEYTHGISNRLTGGPANSYCLSNAEQGGEGWSDYFALMTTTNWNTATVNDGPLGRSIGTYSFGQPVTGQGFRHYPYSTNLAVNPLTYSFVERNNEVHYIGEVWCIALWEMTWEIIKQDNAINTNLFVPGPAASMIGNSAALKLVMEGMRLQPCSPGFIDARNAILKADTLFFNKKYSCSIWKGFAKRGMGRYASQGSSNSTTDQSVDFTAEASAFVLKTNNISVPETQNIVYTNNVTAGGCMPVTNFTLTDTLPANVTYVSGGSYNTANRVVSFNPVTVAAGTTQDYSFTVKINTGSYFPAGSIIDESVASATIPSFWTEASTTTSHWTVSNAPSHSGPFSFFAANQSSISDLVLTTTNSFSLGAAPLTLSFWHYYYSETNWDGGVVEISLNGGSSWQDIGAANFLSCGYSGTLIASGNPLTGRLAFTGNSGGFIKSTINMSPYANQANVKLRFRFGSDQDIGSTGWYVDDIQLKNIAIVNMRTSLIDASNNRISKADTITIILPVNGCAAPIASAVTQPTCSLSTGSVALCDLPSSGTWTINPGGITGTGTSGIISGLASGTYDFTVTSASGCTSIPSTNIIIHAAPVVPTIDAVSNQAVCNNTATTTVNFTGPVTGTVFKWTNNTPTIGLAASGTGNIPSFMATNTTNNSVNATITVTTIGFAYISNSGSNTVSVINTTTNSVVATVPVGLRPFGVSVSPDGSRVYVANSNSNSVSVINTATNSVVATISVGSTPQGVSVNSDGSRVYVTNTYSHNVSVINTVSNLVIATIGVGSYPLGVTVSPDGSRVYIANLGSYTVSVINTTSNSVVASISTGSGAGCLSISPDGSRVYVTNGDKVSLINTASNSVVANINVGSNPIGLAVSPDGSRVYVANAQSNNISVVNTTTNSVVAFIPVGSIPYGLSVSPDGGWVYVTNSLLDNVSIINTTLNVVEATISVGSIPYSFGNFITGVAGIACTGTPKSFTITVSPTATVNTIPNQVVCNNSATTAINFTGSVSGTTFNWTNNTPSIGLAANGSGDINSFTATNSTNNPVTATVTVTPVTVNSSCTSTPKTFTITVIPTVTVNTIPNQVVCNNSSTTAINFTGSVSGTTFNWTNNTPSIGLATSGSGDINSFTATNSTNNPVTASVTVTPSSTAIAYVPNFASNNVSVINMATNSVVATIPVGSGPYGVSVSPDGGKVYIANTISNTLSVINTAANSVVVTVPVGSSPNGVSVSPDGSRVYVANNGSNTVSVINTATNAVLTNISVGSQPRGISISPDGSSVYVANISSNNVSVINTATNAVVATIPVGSAPFGISISPNSSWVYVVNLGSTNVSVINTVTNSVTATIPVGSGPRGVSVSPDGSRVYVTNGGSANVSVINTATNLVLTTIPVGPAPFGVSVSSDGSRVYVANQSSTVSVINTAINSVIATIGVGTNPFSLGNFISGIVCVGTPKTFTITVNPTATVNAISNQVVCNNSATTAINFTGSVAGTAFNWTNNTTSIGLAASGAGDIASFTAINTTNNPVTATVTVTPAAAGFAYIPNNGSTTVSVINTATNSVVATIPVGSGPFGVSVSPDGSRVYITNFYSSNVSIINTATNSVVATVPVGSNPIGISASPDGSRVYVSNYYSDNVSVINTATNSVVATVPVGSNPYGVAVSPDGSRAYVTNSTSGNLSVINTITNSVVATVSIGSGSVGVLVSPDGSRVFAANFESNNVSVINTATNLVVATVPVGTGPFGISVSPDGSRVYVANHSSDNVSVINTTTNSVVTTTTIGSGPIGISVSPDGSRVYVANQYSNSVSVINMVTNLVVATVSVGSNPTAYGNFISGIACSGTPKTFTITVNPPNNWTGAVSTVWENPANWSCGVIPDGNTDVVINSGAAVVNSNAICRTLTVMPGVSFIVNTGFKITIMH